MLRIKCRSLITFLFVYITGAAIVLCTNGCSESGAHKDGSKLLEDGIRNFNTNNTVKAFSELQQAVVELKNDGDLDGHFEACVYLAMVYDQIGQRDQAYKILNSIEFRDVPNYKNYSSQYYLRLMGYYKALFDKNYAEAEKFTRHAIDFSRKKYPGDAAYMYMDMANLAEFYIMSGKRDSAWMAIADLKGQKPVKYDLYLSEMYYCIGRLFYDAHQKDSAYLYFNKSLNVSRKYDAFDNELVTLDMLSKLDSIDNNLVSYISHRQAYDRLKEEIKGNEIHYKVAMLREQHKVDMIRQEGEKSKTIFLLTLCVMFFLILAMAVVFVYIYKSIKIKQKLALLEKRNLDATVEMERLEKELLQLKIAKQGEMLDHTYKENLVMSMKLVENGKEADNIKPLERLLKEMDRNFIKKVETDFPRLSKNDVRLMCLIKVGLPSSEISKMLNITMDSLHKSRYRLRKKLGLVSGQELEAFINSIEC